MSLPDTIFIFVLALIIFGPKKLPEIGRQLGRLVGEFRRASNEFKFQIEEELRQADISDRRSSTPSIGSSAAAVEPAAAPFGARAPEQPPPELAESLPIGQRPNIETLDPSQNEGTGAPVFGFGTPDTALAESGAPAEPASSAPASPLTVIEAAGAQPRTNSPFASQPARADSQPAEPTSAPAEAEIAHG